MKAEKLQKNIKENRRNENPDPEIGCAGTLAGCQQVYTILDITDQGFFFLAYLILINTQNIFKCNDYRNVFFQIRTSFRMKINHLI